MSNTTAMIVLILALVFTVPIAYIGAKYDQKHPRKRTDEEKEIMGIK